MSCKLFCNLNQSYFITINPDLLMFKKLGRESYDGSTNILVWTGGKLNTGCLFLFYRVKNLNNFLKNGRILYTLASKCSLLRPAQFENHQKYPRYIWNEENGSKVRGRLLSRINRKILPIKKKLIVSLG